MALYLGLGKRFAEYYSADLTYNFERATISNINDAASVIIKDQEGTATTSSISPTVSRDSRDNFLDPTRGSRNVISATYAGLGGSNAFIKASIDSGWYFPLGPATFMVRGRFGYARGLGSKKLPPPEPLMSVGCN